MSGASPVAGQVFISYAREDAEHVDKLSQILAAAGVPVWRDTANLWPGEDWRAKIRQAISGASLAFLACFSQLSVSRAKSYQNEELVLAVDELRLYQPDRPWLIPVRFDECDIPDRDLGGGRTFADLQRADLFGAGYQHNADRLVAAIQRILGLSPAATTPAATGPPGQQPKYVINVQGAQGVQIGDGNIQHNTF